MTHLNHEHENDANAAWPFMAGLLIGSLAGAGAMLVLAPQSGQKTRIQLQKETVKLRDQTTEAVEDAVSQTSDKARQFGADVRKQAKELEKRGQAMIDEQKKR